MRMIPPNNFMANPTNKVFPFAPHLETDAMKAATMHCKIAENFHDNCKHHASCNTFLLLSRSFKSKNPSEHMKNEFNTFQCAAKLSCGLENAENFSSYYFVSNVSVSGFRMLMLHSLFAALNGWQLRRAIWITWLECSWKSKLKTLEWKWTRLIHRRRAKPRWLNLPTISSFWSIIIAFSSFSSREKNRTKAVTKSLNMKAYDSNFSKFTKFLSFEKFLMTMMKNWKIFPAHVKIAKQSIQVMRLRCDVLCVLTLPWISNIIRVGSHIRRGWKVHESWEQQLETSHCFAKAEETKKLWNKNEIREIRDNLLMKRDLNCVNPANLPSTQARFRPKRFHNFNIEIYVKYPQTSIHIYQTISMNSS